MDKRIPGIRKYEQSSEFLDSVFTMLTHPVGHLLIDITEMKEDSYQDSDDIGVALKKLFDVNCCRIHCTERTTPQDIINAASSRRWQGEDKKLPNTPMSLNAQLRRRGNNVNVKGHRHTRQARSNAARQRSSTDPLTTSDSQEIKAKDTNMKSPSYMVPQREIQLITDFREKQDKQVGGVPQISASQARGGSFATIWIISDIDKAPCKTQFFLLQAMARRIIHVDNRPSQLPEFHRIIASRSSQGNGKMLSCLLDYFLMEIPGSIFFAEQHIFLHENRNPSRIPMVEWLHIEDLKSFDTHVPIDLELMGFARDIVVALRHDCQVQIGPSVLARTHFRDVLKIRALLRASDFVKPHDFPSVASLVLSHRITTKGGLDKFPRSVVREVVFRLANKTLLPPK
ncbi:hypothetical protein AAMO2058_000244500 [Amorphochlora amoebiformis]